MRWQPVLRSNFWGLPGSLGLKIHNQNYFLALNVQQWRTLHNWQGR
jgi:hypothetical protein